jgi:hypothetical protein
MNHRSAMSASVSPSASRQRISRSRGEGKVTGPVLLASVPEEIAAKYLRHVGSTSRDGDDRLQDLFFLGRQKC